MSASSEVSLPKPNTLMMKPMSPSSEVLIIDLMGGHYRGIIDLLIYTMYIDNFHMRFSI